MNAVQLDDNISFDIPVVLFFFKRVDTTLKILDRIKKVKPRKIYLISDGPRDSTEQEEIINCRKQIEAAINWNCEIVRNYAEENKGVYDRIGVGAKWVLSLEPSAIFLEDDNLPEVEFFYFCKNLLERYENNSKVFWICGTNYLENYEPIDGSSYVFTKHLMPCGWASWSHKFPELYDGELKMLSDHKNFAKLKDQYEDKRLYKQQLRSGISELEAIKYNGRPTSWDFQMALTIRMNDVFGISPKKNLIKNIGVDMYSTHGGTSYDNPMTERFCKIESYPLEMPLIHPKYILTDKIYEERVGNIILYPFFMRFKFAIKRFFSNILRKIFKIHPQDRITDVVAEKLNLFNKKKV
ncbi:glycosyltransferase family 2 protein [Desemzia incerta]|uniref:glycosyltransferase family 2 protein n=1 Tax=Desemzia incerta TaxID=82801 RepID=UPI001660A8DC|nr:glycosyltransferase family 2 protein [Desemzia incerta]